MWTIKYIRLTVKQNKCHKTLNDVFIRNMIIWYYDFWNRDHLLNKENRTNGSRTRTLRVHFYYFIVYMWVSTQFLYKYKIMKNAYWYQLLVEHFMKWFITICNIYNILNKCKIVFITVFKFSNFNCLKGEKHAPPEWKTV